MTREKKRKNLSNILTKNISHHKSLSSQRDPSSYMAPFREYQVELKLKTHSSNFMQARLLF